MPAASRGDVNSPEGIPIVHIMRIGILTGKESFTKFPGCHTERGFRRKLDHTRQILAGLHAKVLKCSSLFAYRYDYCRFCSFNRCISCIDA